MFLKLTSTDGDVVLVNMDRIAEIKKLRSVTVLFSHLSSDVISEYLEVKESQADIMRMMVKAERRDFRMAALGLIEAVGNPARANEIALRLSADWLDG